MKSAIRLFPMVLVLAACNRDETSSAPKAVEIEDVPVAVVGSTGAPKAIVIPETETAPSDVIHPHAGEVIVHEEIVAPAPPGERLARVVEKVGQGLETAGQKTQEAAAAAEERVPEAIETAREKTETGLRKAAGATGDFLKRTGEKIEEKAGEAEEP